MSLNSSSLLRDFLKLPEIREVLANPDKYPYITEPAVDMWKNMMASILKEGIKGEIISNLIISTYDPFLDGVASQVVGRAKFEIACVVKAGGEDVKGQTEFMKSFSSMDLFPKILSEGQLNDNYICLMENLARYKSLHEYVFKAEANSIEEIQLFLGYYYQWLGEIYSYYRVNNTPIMYDTYIEPRLIRRVEEAKKKLKEKNIKVLSLDIDTLLRSRIVFEGEELRSFDDLMKEVISSQVEIETLSPVFSTFVHGDAHPANIMILRQPPYHKIKFIDPNPSLGGRGDYIYDQGKMFHWLDMMGFAVLERGLQARLFAFEHETKSDYFHVNIKWLDSTKVNLAEVINYQSRAFEYSMANLSSLADSFNDKTWKKRLYLSIAASYLGGLPRLEDPNHLAVLFVQGLKYLNKFINE